MLNCANEKAVELFLAGKIGFGDIQKIVKNIYEKADFVDIKSALDAKEIFREVVEKTAADYNKILRM